MNQCLRCQGRNRRRRLGGQQGGTQQAVAGGKRLSRLHRHLPHQVLLPLHRRAVRHRAVARRQLQRQERNRRRPTGLVERKQGRQPKKHEQHQRSRNRQKQRPENLGRRKQGVRHHPQQKDVQFQRNQRRLSMWCLRNLLSAFRNLRKKRMVKLHLQ